MVVQDLPFDDGMPPPDNVVVDWFEVLRSRFTADPTSCVAVHCIAGLGRCPSRDRLVCWCFVDALSDTFTNNHCGGLVVVPPDTYITQTLDSLL